MHLRSLLAAMDKRISLINHNNNDFVDTRTGEGVLIDDDLLDLIAVLVQEVLEVDLRGVIGVRPEHHGAVLPVEGEVCCLGCVHSTEGPDEAGCTLNKLT